MAETHVISALVKKRSEIAGQIAYYEKLLKDRLTDLSTIDRAIYIFDENYDVNSISPKKFTKKSYFSNGEATKLVLDVLRVANKPLRTDEISDIVASKKSLNLDGKDRVNFQKSILYALNTCEKRGLVTTVGKEGLSLVWSIAKIN